jgi:hypothetical protein
MGFDVFVSHSSKDKAIADAACAALEAAGIRCWIAPRDIMPGMEYGAAIVDALDHCRVLVLIFSANANESPQLRREVEHAVSRAVPIVPVRIENVLPTRSMAYFVESVHWLDALTPPMESHLHRLAEAVKAMLQVDRAGAGAASVAEGCETAAPAPTAQAASGVVGPAAGPGRPSGEPRRFPVPWTVERLFVAAAFLLVCAGLVIYRSMAEKHGPVAPLATPAIEVSAPQPPSAAIAAPSPSQAAAAAQAVKVPAQQAAGSAGDSSGAARTQNPVDGGMPVTIGDTYEMVSAAYKTLQRPTPSPWNKEQETWLYLKDLGIEFFFDSSQKIDAIHFVAPWSGSIRGVKLGDTRDRIKSLLGEPTSAEERFGGITLALVYRWPYTLKVEFHVESKKVEIIILE